MTVFEFNLNATIICDSAPNVKDQSALIATALEGVGLKITDIKLKPKTFSEETPDCPDAEKVATRSVTPPNIKSPKKI